jgi:hypothetical protein
MAKDDEICGQSLDTIRKSYFKGKIPKLLSEIQATGEYYDEDFNELKTFLEALKKKDESLGKSFGMYLPKLEEETDTILDDLNKESLTEAEKAELEKDQANREFSVKTSSSMVKSVFKKFYNPKEPSPSDNELMDMAFELLALQYYLIRDGLYKERKYRLKIVEYERTGKQRKLAEEYAKGGVEYRDYALAEGLKDIVNEFINLAKKRYKNL